MTTRLLRVPAGASLLPSLRADRPGPAWVHAAGRLAAAELRAADGSAHTLLGELVLVSLEGPLDGPLFALIQVLEPLGARLAAGELVEAVTATALDACLVGEGEAPAAPRAADSAAYVRAPHPSAPSVPPTPALSTLSTLSTLATPAAAPSEPSFARAIEASADRPSSPSPFVGGLGGAGLAQPIPTRPVRPQVAEEETPTPDPGDRVEHFAFGSCEVVKSDGERLHLRLGKNGSIKEIALEMLRVSELPADEGPGRRFKLERRL
ncbi:MAG: hypothetical protein IPF92_02220 [Myxococcales bacterium]|nr:hypothetical protein [Myxococcales bacterium]